ncbi:hypothetical protein [Blastococcus mobilis]|uniref:hypothetical protein n=1 Tax=Blastococcus mobilis TaxID=1938746 RepID=UPI001C3CEA1C|nr:hypothetical protein [Blastococcus mobilis]
MEDVVEPVGQLTGGDAADVALDEHLVEEADDQWGVVGANQPPRWAVALQCGDVVVVHGTSGSGSRWTPMLGTATDRTQGPR